MVAGFSLRAILGYLHSDDLSGLRGFLLNVHVQVDERDEDGWSALIHAGVLGKDQAVLILIESGAELDLKDNDGCTALVHAARESKPECCKVLIEKGATVDAKDSNLWTPFLWASYVGDQEVSGLLLNAGSDVNVRGMHHCTGLVWAAGKDQVGLIKLLLHHGAKVETGDKYGTTPLIWACRKGNVEIVEALLGAGAQVDSTGMYSWTPLLVAVRGNFPHIVSLLLQHGPNVNAVDQEGLTALAIACKEGSTDIVYQLIAAGAYVNLQDRGGDTNLILACKGGHKAIVEALLKRYADVDTKGKENKTCLYWAVEKNHTSIIRTLLNANPDLEIATVEGNTPLLRAVKNRNTEIVQLLLDKKAKMTAIDKMGDTALHVAMRARSKAIVEILLRNPKHSQLLYKPNRAGETPYNIDISNQKTILGQVFGARKLNTNEDTENMLGYDLYGSALADILTEPSLSMPITVGLYAKWGSGKSFLLKKLQEEMQNFARDWIDPTFHMSPLLFCVVFHLSSFLGLLAWIISYHHDVNSFLVLFLVTVGTLLLCYIVLFGVWQGTFKSDWYTLYNINVALAKKFNELKLLVNVVFNHPPGSKWIGRQEKAQPLKLFFTDQSKVSTSAGAENSVIQIIGSLYDSLEATYGTFATRLYRAFRPKPVKSTAPTTLRKLCCIPYGALYLFSYVLVLVEIVLIIMKAEGIQHTSISQSEKDSDLIEDMENESDDDNPLVNEPVEDENPIDLDRLVFSLLITLAVILCVIVVANIYTIGQTLNAVLFSQRTHLQRAVAKHDLVQSEGYLQAVKKEVNLLHEMVKTLDAFSGQQSRLIVVVDGLDSVEQRKVLSVLDTVHTLFSDPGSPFIIVLAIDPHVITKAIELNLNQVFSDTSIGGHAYLRNMVHLPFFLQNAGLRKVKMAQQVANKLKMSHSWYENEEAPSRKVSMESEDPGNLSRGPSKMKKKKKQLSGCESAANSISSNLNKITQGPLELNKMFLTDDYFSDVNPRSMRRLMNVIYVMGRLLKAFNIDFNWHHLASWANITEQWPYHTSWITLFVEHSEDKLDDSVSLKQVYDKVKPSIPTQKEIEPLLENDRDEKKMDVFLSLHKKTLTVADLKIFLPFTINLDPFLKKVIKDEVQNMEELGLSLLSSPQAQVKQVSNGNPLQTHQVPNKAPLTRRQAVELSKKIPDINPYNQHLTQGFMPPVMGLPYGWPYGQAQFVANQEGNLSQPSSSMINSTSPGHSPRPILPRELQGLVLSSFNLEQVSTLVRTIEGINTSMVDTYCASIMSNNVTGKVLLYCQTNELRNVINMNFGDWELFKLVLKAMREDEHISPNRITTQADVVADNLNPDREFREASHEKISRSETKYRHHKHQTAIEKQVAMEEATVSGLLSTLNEEAKEDILLEEINNAKEEADILSHQVFDRQTSHDNEESDFLYYSHPSPKVYNQEVMSESGMFEGIERGKSRIRTSVEMIWSATNSRAGSIHDLDSAGLCAPNLKGSTVTLATLKLPPTMTQAIPTSHGASHNKRQLNMTDRANTVVSFVRPHSINVEEDDPYSWLSHTAPASPREGRHRSHSESVQIDRESDPGYNNSKTSIFNRSIRRTKKKSNNEDANDPDGSTENLSRSGSRVRLDKVKRRIRNALTSNEPGQLPIVQRARPNPEEYHQFNQSEKNSRSSSFSESVCLSDESLSSPEQRTVTRRPPATDSHRPTVQTLFTTTEEEEPRAILTAVLPDGSKMTSPEKIFHIGGSDKKDF
eukprot:GFUD01001744.1.p1 GENE.GFUD01001744.1~~GFUD01001744.1.p1  ORF type:complete len:1748 (+),score=397.63 GFUD01001744.1:305-5548(+)